MSDHLTDKDAASLLRLFIIGALVSLIISTSMLTVLPRAYEFNQRLSQLEGRYANMDYRLCRLINKDSRLSPEGMNIACVPAGSDSD